MNPGMGNNILNGPTGFQQQQQPLGGNPLALNMTRPPPNQNILEAQMSRMSGMTNNDPSAQMVCDILVE